MNNNQNANNNEIWDIESIIRDVDRIESANRWDTLETDDASIRRRSKLARSSESERTY